jgi:ABC-type Fe3+-hydroxamate transport system substrate-binding protein
MDKKILAIVLVAILIVAGAGAALLLMGNNNNDKPQEDLSLTHRLTALGNVFSDDTLDDNDVTVLQAYLDGKKTVTVAGNEIDLTDSEVKKYCDVDNNGKINSADLDALKTIIKGQATRLFYENANGDIAGVDVPINNILVMFRRVGTTVAMVGASDMVKGFISDMAEGGNYGFLGFKGTNLGSGSEPDFELIKSLNTQYKSTGGVTLIADATGAAANLEEKVGSGIDVVRIPVTEMGKSENGVVTLGYLLAYGNANHDKIIEKLDSWIEWNDSAKEKIQAAVDKMTDSQKKSCIIALWNASAASATVNTRAATASENVYTNECGGKNLITGAGGSYAMNDFNEYILTVNPDVTFIMQQEVYLLKNKISAQTTYDDFMSQLTKNYNGKVGMFSQFFGTGPGYILSMMYYANALVPELKGAFDLQKEYEFFMGDLVGNKELAKLTAFVEIN